MKRYLLLSMLLAVLLLAACTPAAAPLPATVAPTGIPAQPSAAPATAQPTATAEPTAQPSPVSMDQINLSVDIPNGIASDYEVVTVPVATEFHPHPEYRALNLNGYAIPGAADQPRIDVFPVDAFGETSPSASKTIFDLGILISSQQMEPGQRLPFLSVAIEAQTFTAQPKFLTFANGSGVRYLT